MTGETSYDIFSAMQDGEPKASFKKVCVGKIQVKILDPFNPTEVEQKILEGDPYNPTLDQNNIIIDVWTEKEEVFFRKANKYHFDNGNIIEFDRQALKKQALAAKNFNVLTDEEILNLVSAPFLSLKHALDKTTSIPTVMRILQSAKDNDKTEKIVKAIEQRLTELQTANPLHN